MTEAAERVVALRARVARRERELDAALRELKATAQRALEPGHWIGQRPLLFMTGALLVGWWAGRYGAGRLRR
jgi:hypothetical protein